MKIDPVDFTDKTNLRTIVDRTKQSTAEDWNEVKRITDSIVAYLHIESDDIDLVDGETLHTITFEDEFANASYRVLGREIVVYTGDSSGEITEIAIKNITRYVGYLTFETYNAASSYKVDYEIKERL